MYKKSAQGWLKHWDFILMDVVCLQIAFVIAYLSRLGIRNPYNDQLYRNQAIVLIFCQVFVAFFGQTFRDILRRGYYVEFIKTVKHVCAVMLLDMLYMFMTQQSVSYSRLTFIITAAVYFILAYAQRVAWKAFLVKRGKGTAGKRSMVVITVWDTARDVLKRLDINPYDGFAVTGIALLDKNLTGQYIRGVPVVGDAKSIKDYVCREWVDEVFVSIPDDAEYPKSLVDAFILMGVTVHMTLSEIDKVSAGKQHVEKMGDYTVLTTSINMTTPKQLLWKRLIDIMGGLAGCLLTGILFIFVAPAIYIKSPGPIFFSQIRIGKNGRKFKIYKFRSMYMDAEERKKELMEQNKVKDGFMFKMDFDPRIIGSEKLDKNGNPKGIGNFIRKTSIDEFPQFWNVLKGDMSLVGTRPPTVDEWEKYDLHHRARMAIKPGITGMWQVSGRSDITDFEEVVRLDTEYIENWSIGLDIKILGKTVLTVLHNDGAM
ncbi:MAG: sugar transferase [Eubacteriales bacterium]|nr:sugar transferase [Eubacteriales bacterium]